MVAFVVVRITEGYEAFVLHPRIGTNRRLGELIGACWVDMKLMLGGCGFCFLICFGWGVGRFKALILFGVVDSYFHNNYYSC